MVTIAYDPERTAPEELAKTIAELGYTLEEVEPPSSTAEAEGKHISAPLPEGAPAYFKEAFQRARSDGRPIVIDFWATWCGPCVQLKTQTLADGAVAKALEAFVVIQVDLDENPELAAAYGVTAIPDVFFIDKDGILFDRLRGFEEPGPFLSRLNKLIELGPQENRGSPGELERPQRR